MPGHEQPEILLAKLEMTRDYYSMLMSSLLDPAVIHHSTCEESSYHMYSLFVRCYRFCLLLVCTGMNKGSRDGSRIPILH